MSSRRWAAVVVAAALVTGAVSAAPADGVVASTAGDSRDGGFPSVPSGSVPGSARRYIVRLSPGAPAAMTAASLGRRGAVGEVRFVYEGAFEGFAATLSDAQVAALRGRPDVVGIEPDGVMHLDRVAVTGREANAPWGLDRLDQHALPLSGSYTYPGTASGVTAYIVDSGIRLRHREFTGRIRPGYSAIQDGRGVRDCHGHGTHVSGLVAGTHFGVAKRALIRPVRVFGCSGGTSTSTVIAGLNWVLRDHQRGEKSVLNMSLGGPPSAALDAAVRAVISDGVTVVVAAGNSGRSACEESPARVPAAITVGAMDSRDRVPDWSNNGRCVDLHAPGVSIRSAWNTASNATMVLDGTSMASPHVTGVAAVLLGLRRQSPSDLADRVMAYSSSGMLARLASGTPNRLVHLTPDGLPPRPPDRPANDAFAAARDLNVPAIGSGSVSATNVNATKEPGEPNHAGRLGGHSVWWRFTAAANGRVSFATAGSAFDTTLAAYTGSSVGALTSIASNDNDVDTSSRISFAVSAGTTYRIAVDGFGGEWGRISLSYSSTATGSGPVNDAFANRIQITGTLPIVVTGSNVGASREAGEPSHAGMSGGRSVWWYFTPAFSDWVSISTSGSDFDTLLAVYRGSSVGALSPVAANDDDGDSTSYVSFYVQEGVTYSVAVDGYSGDSGSIRLTLE